MEALEDHERGNSTQEAEEAPELGGEHWTIPDRWEWPIPGSEKL